MKYYLIILYLRKHVQTFGQVTLTLNDLLQEIGYSTKTNNKSIYSDFREIIKTELINKGYASCNTDIFVVKPNDLFYLQLSYERNVFFTEDSFVQITISEYEKICSLSSKINKSILLGIYLYIKQFIMDYPGDIAPAKISFPSKSQIAKGLDTSIPTVENGLSVLLEECHTSIFDFVLKAYLKNKYHICLNVIPNQLDSIPKNSPISIFLARKILDFVKNYDESDVYELANILYNEIVTRHYSYQKLKLLIVSSLNKTSHESLKYRLFNRYSSYIESIDNAHFYELSEDLVNNYDAVLYFQKDGMILPSYIKKKCALDYFINYNDFSEIFEELIVPHFIYKNPFDFNHKMKKIKYKSTNELKNYSIEIYNQVGITILFTKEKPETIYYTFDKMQKLNGRKIKEGFIFIVNIQDDMLSLKMAENFLRLITQSKQAKDYVIQENGDVYTKVLHHRRQFV